MNFFAGMFIGAIVVLIAEHYICPGVFEGFFDWLEKWI